MSWGIRIALLYTGFVGIILTLVFICMSHKTELEYKDYYARELKFQDQINAAANTRQLKATIGHEIKDRSILISIPSEISEPGMCGIIRLMRPSDSSLDLQFIILPDVEGRQMINDHRLRAGVYKLIIEISSGGKDYYKESVITLK
jgi:hypothetical protein